MSFNVGELVAYLRLDYDDFERGATTAQATADKLDGKRVDLKVDADTAAAETKLAAVAASEDKVDEGNKKVAASSKPAAQGMGALASAIVLLGPALVPVATGLAGVTVGLGAMGAAGVLAIVGIKEQMADGTALGGQYTAMLATLKGDLSTLAATAAGGVLGPFQHAVSDLQTSMPALNGDMGEFSTITGKAAGALVTGMVSAFLALAPLARDADVYILGLSNRFAEMMSGPGVVAFGTYARSVFPQVMQAITSVGDAVIHLVAAIAPLGMGSLSILQTFASVINAIPVPVLTALAEAGTAVYVSVSLFKLLKGPIDALSAAMLASGTAAEVAAAGVRTLTMAAGLIGAALGVATLIFSAFADTQRQNTQAANDFADALRQDSGAIGENTRALAVNELQKHHALDLARELGINLSLVTDAALGQGDALKELTLQMNSKYGPAMASNAGQATDMQQKVIQLNEAVNGVNSDLGSGIQKQKDYAEATAVSAAAVPKYTAAQEALAAKIGTTAAALAVATAGQQTTADAAASAAAKMYIENDAAGILKASLDLLNGKGLSLMQAQTASAAATNSATDALKKNKSAIEGTSAAAVANQQALQAKAQASQMEAEAVGKATGSTEAAVKAYRDSKTALEGSLKAQGLLTPAVQAYIDKLYDVSNVKVAPTKLEIDKAQADADLAALQKQIDSIHAQPIVLQFTANYSSAVATALGAARAAANAGHAAGGLIGHAGGGLIFGPGSGTSDSILGVNASGVPITRVSSGEFVVNAAATARNRALLESINSGQPGGGVGGPVQIDVHPSAAMDEGAVAIEVARRLNMAAAV